MKTEINENAKKEMQTSLETYKKDKNSAKEFYPCTKKVTLWLQKKAK
jgi:hypothetical protein